MFSPESKQFICATLLYVLTFRVILSVDRDRYQLQADRQYRKNGAEKVERVECLWPSSLCRTPFSCLVWRSLFFDFLQSAKGTR